MSKNKHPILRSILYKWLQFTYSFLVAPFYLFFCSDNAGSLSKVVTTEEEIDKEKENSAANIYSGIDVRHRTFS